MNKKRTSKVMQAILATTLSAQATLLNLGIAYSDAFTQADNAVSGIFSKLKHYTNIFFPFSLVILIIAILFTHDQKALATELKTAALICIAYIGFLIVTDPGFLSTFNSLVSGTIGTGT